MLDVAHFFPGVADGVYLNTASMALGNAPAATALSAAARQWEAGRFSWLEAEAAGEEVRTLAADLLGVPVSTIALTAGAAGGAATIAHQLPVAPAGGNVVVPERDFMSNFIAWAMLEERGYELRTVPDVDGRLAIDAFVEVVDSGTSVIAASLIQSSSGYRLDIDGLKELAADNRSWLVFDVSQAFGATAFDLDGVTGVFSCSHKWSLGTRGLGLLYVAPGISERLRPVLPGWKAVTEPTASFYGPGFELADTAARLDVSWPWFNPLADVEGLRILHSIGIDAIEDHNRRLVEALAEGGGELAFDAHERSAILALDVADPDAALTAMRHRNMVASLRGGRLRISLHLYNTLDDVAEVLEVLSLR